MKMLTAAVLLFAFTGCCFAACPWPPCAENGLDAPGTQVSDSCVHFVAHPDVIEKDISDKLELRCEYSGSSPVVSIGIGKKGNGNTTGLAYIVSGPSDTTWVAPGLQGVANGAINSNIGGKNRSHISIQWRKPSTELGGNYVCLISEIPSFGQVRQRQSSVYVKATGITEQSLLKRLEKLEAELETVKSKLEGEQKSMRVIHEALFSETSTYQNRSYYLSEYLPASYVKAEPVCEALGGYLAEIDDKAEYDFIVQFLQPRVATQVVVLIAGTDEGHTGKWIFQRTNKTVSFADWWPGEPNGLGIEHRLSLMNNRAGPGVHMNNMYFPFIPLLETDYQYGFLCEVPNHGSI